MLRRLDRHERIRFVDIAADGFDAATVGKSLDALLARIHGRLPDGSLVTGVEVFRRLYTAVGFGSLVALSRLPGIAQLLDAGYEWFARRRVRMGGRCDESTCASGAPSARGDTRFGWETDAFSPIPGKPPPCGRLLIGRGLAPPRACRLDKPERL